MSKTKQQNTTEEHPEARQWRLQLCGEQGRRFKLERENKDLRGVLMSALVRLRDIEREIEMHRDECTAHDCLCGYLDVL